MRKKNKEGDFMPTAIIMTPTKKTLNSKRTSLDEISNNAKQRRKDYSCKIYDAKNENDFFELVESSIYEEIVSDDMVNFITNNQAITSNMSYEEKIRAFNQFIDDNMDFIDKFLPENPAISKDDEWRTDNYSDYDDIRKHLDD